MENDGAQRVPPSEPLREASGYAVVDVETTGLSPRRDRIVSIGVVLLTSRGEIEHEWGTLVNPQGPVGATHIHGIRDEDVVDAPTFDSLAAPIVNLLRGRAVAGHNVAFDSSFLKFEFGRAGWGWPSVPTLCTLKESFYFLPHLDRRRLADCCVACGIRLDGAHTALGDARATAQLLRNYLDPYVGIAPQAVHRSILSVAASTPWPSAPHGRRIDPQDTRRTLSPRALHVIARPAPSRATSLLERFTLSDAVEEGAPPGVLSYLETLAQVLEDGEISATERAALTDVAELYELTSQDCDTAHRGFVRALAREAFEDGLLSRMEKAEILRLATLIGVDLDAVAELLSGAEETRLLALSAGLTPLPDDWALGEPLRVGQRIAFTGCDPDERDGLEARAAAAGLRVVGSVSRRTAVLVTDGSYDGQKAAAAAELGTRVVHPSVFELLLNHIQPWTGVALQPVAKINTVAAGIALRAAGPSTDPVAECFERPSPATVRAWALANGLSVGVRGRVAAEIWDAYADAHRS